MLADNRVLAKFAKKTEATAKTLEVRHEVSQFAITKILLTCPHLPVDSLLAGRSLALLIGVTLLCHNA